MYETLISELRMVAKEVVVHEEERVAFDAVLDRLLRQMDLLGTMYMVDFTAKRLPVEVRSELVHRVALIAAAGNKTLSALASFLDRYADQRQRERERE